MSSATAESPEIRLVREVPEKELASLYREVGWLQTGDDTSFIPTMLKGSLLAAGAFAEGHLIGFARILGDGVSDACIQDVMVAPVWRRRGIAAKMLRLLLTELQKTGTGFIQLIAEPGAEDLYRTLGFAPMAGCIPMKYTGGKKL